MKRVPSAEQIKALQQFAAANGRNWKSALNHLWMTGAYNNAVMGDADSMWLQRIRNQFGPKWLYRFSLKGAMNAQA